MIRETLFARCRILLVAACACAAAGLCACGSSDPPKFNLVLIVMDTLRPDHTGAYGYGRPTTPHLDRLAGQGVRFETAVAPASFTLPSMATLFTSLNPIDHGVRSHLDWTGSSDVLDDRFHTLAEQLQEKGYHTGAVVSNSLFLRPSGFDQGFAHFDPGGRRDAGPTTDAALNWLARKPQDTPFFLWVHYIDPHWPYDAPRDFERPFGHNDRGQFQRVVRTFLEGRIKSDKIYFENTLDTDGVKRGIAEYDNEIAYADHHLGRLLDGLKSKNLYDNTVIALVSDHGESLGEHDLYFAHSFFLYDEIQKVVMILKPPGPPAPRVVEQPVRLLDLMPTLFTLLELDPESRMEGRDLAPLFAAGAEAAEWPDLPAYAEAIPRHKTQRGAYRYPYRKRAHGLGIASKWRMIRTRDHKLIYIPGEGFELYDLRTDPHELHNIVDEQPKIAGSLRRSLEDWMAKEPETPDAESQPTIDTNEETLRLIREMGY